MSGEQPLVVREPLVASPDLHYELRTEYRVHLHATCIHTSSYTNHGSVGGGPGPVVCRFRLATFRSSQFSQGVSTNRSCLPEYTKALWVENHSNFGDRPPHAEATSNQRVENSARPALTLHRFARAFRVEELCHYRPRRHRWGCPFHAPAYDFAWLVND